MKSPKLVIFGVLHDCPSHKPLTFNFNVWGARALTHTHTDTRAPTHTNTYTHSVSNFKNPTFWVWNDFFPDQFHVVVIELQLPLNH